MKCSHQDLVQLTLAIAVIALPRPGMAGETSGTLPVGAPTGSVAAPAAPARQVPPARHEPPPAVSAEPETPPPAIDSRVHFDALLGFGGDNLNLGIGVRGGKTYDNHVYLGGTFVYHIGESTSSTVEGMTESTSVSAFYLGPEIGYDFALTAPAPFVLRPYIGIGVADATASSSNGGSASKSELSMWPGVVGHYQLADSKFEIGADLRLVTGPWGTAFSFFALGAMHFGS